PQELVMEEDSRRLVDGAQAAPGGCLGRLGQRVVVAAVKRDAGALGQQRQRLAKVQPLLLLNESEEVAALAAAKALPGAWLGRHVERGGPLAVKWAQAFIGLARLLERDDRADLLNDVELRLDALDYAAGLGQLPLLLSRATGLVRSVDGLLLCIFR